MQIIAYLIAAIVPLFVLVVIRALDLYGMGAFQTVLLCFGWGLCAYGLSYLISIQVLYNMHILEYQQIARFAAPVYEEIFKALILIYLVRRPNFTYFVDGAIYGFAAGMGFAIIENIQYIALTPLDSFGTAVSRVLSVNLVHATATALVGIALGKARFSRNILQFLGYLLSGLLVAMLLHGAFNNIVAIKTNALASGSPDPLPGPLLLYGAIIGFAGVAAIAFIIFRGLAEQRMWIEEKLGMADRVTAGEAKIARRLEDVSEILKPLRQQFGDEKADQVEEFVMTQARLGIKRKTLEKLPDEKMRQAVEKEMVDLRAKMDEARRKVGPYVMLCVRNIFPEETSPLWNLLETRIQERITARQQAPSGANLFASLGQRMAAKPADEKPTPPPDS